MRYLLDVCYYMVFTKLLHLEKNLLKVETTPTPLAVRLAELAQSYSLEYPI